MTICSVSSDGIYMFNKTAGITIIYYAKLFNYINTSYVKCIAKTHDKI